MKRAILTIALMNLFGLFARAETLPVGAPAPAITATSQDGTPVDFSKIYAKGITLVYFYPKAETPGCTAQACSLRDSYADLTAKGIQVIGVSRDKVAAQKQFQEKYKLPFTLIADESGDVAKAFGVDLIPVVGLTKRESFLVKDGKIAWVDTNAKTTGHADEVREAVAGLK
jgi:thioredoxin-dependent peroxiredoxin